MRFEIIQSWMGMGPFDTKTYTQCCRMNIVIPSFAIGSRVSWLHGMYDTTMIQAELNDVD